MQDVLADCEGSFALGNPVSVLGNFARRVLLNQTLTIPAVAQLLTFSNQMKPLQYSFQKFMPRYLPLQLNAVTLKLQD